MDNLQTTDIQERHRAIIEKIVELARCDAEENNKVITCIKVSWTQVGYDLMTNGCTIEYKEKPKRNTKP